jgi:dTDP-4-dehydrorhamnose reductase
MILVTGGTGLLGRALRNWLPEALFPSRKDMDITSGCPYLPNWRQIELIVHCAAYTDVAKAESQKDLCYATNVIGTRNLVKTRTPMIYISTEYVFDGEKGNYVEEDTPNPKNFYALTKLLGEFEARKAVASCIIRTCFKPRPFEHAAACVDQYTSGDYVDVIAREIVTAVRLFQERGISFPEILHIGTERKSVFELACQSRKDLIPITVETIGVKLPKDTSLNTTRWETIKRGAGL